MNKEQLITKAAKEGKLTQREVRQSLNAVIQVLVNAFENDKNVSIGGLGTFLIRKRSNVKKYLPKDGNGPVKGVTGERAMFAINDRRFIQFNPAPYINREYADTVPRCTPIEELPLDDLEPLEPLEP